MTAISSTPVVAPTMVGERVILGVSAESRVDNFPMPRAGLDLPQRLPFNRWLTIGNFLSTVHTSSAWCLGDWLLYGEETYPGRYRDAIEQTSLDYQTLRNYAWVARHFPISRRRDALSFGHHAEVASRPASEQDFWLRKAEELGWSRNRLRREVRSSLSERAPGDEKQGDQKRDKDGRDGQSPATAGASDGTDEESRVLRLEATAERFEHWKGKACESGLSVEAWALHALDDASEP
jgi:hypothetical protein